MNTSISANTTAVTGGTAVSLQAQRPSAGQRWLSLGEFLLGSAIVIGHNVYRVVPNEVPILFVLALISFRLRDGWSALGLCWPVSWRRTILIALAAAVLRILVSTLVIEPVTAHFWPPAIAPSGMKDMAGHGMQALKWFLLVWTFAAFGEEIGYRGYLINRAADAGGRSKAVYWIAVVLVSVLFGYGHYYKGPAGVVDSGMAGLVLGAAYVLSGRNLWVCVLAHGFIDTIGLIAVFFGWSS
jgi:membrane protease YdiL (CAAX protease family)